MKKILAILFAVLLVGLVPTVATAAPRNVSCALILVTPEIPAQAAVIGYETIPAVAETLFEFVHRNPKHPNSPRWEAEGWNADSNPNSVGWYSAGNTKQIVLVEESVRTYEISPAVPAVPAVTREECITEPDVFVPGPTTTAVPIPDVTPTADPAPSDKPKPTLKPTPVSVVEPVETPTKPVVTVRSDLITPGFEKVVKAEKPAQLAETGVNPFLAAGAALLLLAGLLLVRFAQKRV